MQPDHCVRGVLGVPQQMADELNANESVDPRAKVIDDNAGSFRECFEAADGWRLEDVEKAEEKECENRVRPVRWDGDECDQLPRNLVDDDEARVLPAGLTRDACGCRNAECDRECERDERCDEEMPRVAVQQPGTAKPEQNRDRGGIGAGTGL